MQVLKNHHVCDTLWRNGLACQTRAGFHFASLNKNEKRVDRDWPFNGDLCEMDLNFKPANYKPLQKPIEQKAHFRLLRRLELLRKQVRDEKSKQWMPVARHS